MFRSITIAVAAATFLTGTSVAAHDTDTLPRSALKWNEAIPNVVSFAPAHGNWEAAHGKFARVESGATVPMHTHTHPYHAVLISGALTNLLDSDPTRVELTAGDYWHMAGGRAHGHVCTSTEPCLVYMHSDDAWDLALVE